MNVQTFSKFMVLCPTVLELQQNKLFIPSVSHSLTLKMKFKYIDDKVIVRRPDAFLSNCKHMSKVTLLGAAVCNKRDFLKSFDIEN